MSQVATQKRRWPSMIILPGGNTVLVELEDGIGGLDEPARKRNCVSPTLASKCCK